MTSNLELVFQPIQPILGSQVDLLFGSLVLHNWKRFLRFLWPIVVLRQKVNQAHADGWPAEGFDLSNVRFSEAMCRKPMFQTKPSADRVKTFRRTESHNSMSPHYHWLSKTPSGASRARRIRKLEHFLCIIWKYWLWPLGRHTHNEEVTLNDSFSVMLFAFSTYRTWFAMYSAPRIHFFCHYQFCCSFCCSFFTAKLLIVPIFGR